MVLRVQGRQVGDGGWRAGTGGCSGLKTLSFHGVVASVWRGQGDVLQVGGEGPSAVASIGLVATPRGTHFLLMTSILLLLLLVQAANEEAKVKVVRLL